MIFNKASFIFSLSISLFSLLYGTESYRLNYRHEASQPALFGQEHTITCHSQEAVIGFIAYTHIPLTNYYILYDFYVYPIHRNKGYGSQLLTYACDYLKHIGATRIYLQPGPFELYPHQTEDRASDTHTHKLMQLVEFYKRHQFVAASYISYIARLIYSIMGIQEDPTYLMVKIFH